MQNWSADNSGIRKPRVSHYGNEQTELAIPQLLYLLPVTVSATVEERTFQARVKMPNKWASESVWELNFADTPLRRLRRRVGA